MSKTTTERQPPQVGEKLYSLNVGNAARGCEKKLTPVTVTKVGRKYFTCGEGWGAVQYHLSDWRQKTEYGVTSRLYRDPQEWEDKRESEQLLREVRGRLDWGSSLRLTLDQLRRIKSIIEETDDASPPND